MRRTKIIRICSQELQRLVGPQNMRGPTELEYCLSSLIDAWHWLLIGVLPRSVKGGAVRSLRERRVQTSIDALKRSDAFTKEIVVKNSVCAQSPWVSTSSESSDVHTKPRDTLLARHRRDAHGTVQCTSEGIRSSLGEMSK